MCETESYYHATNEGGYIRGCDVYNQYGLTIKNIPVTKEKYGLSKATRQINSRLDKSKLLENGFELLQTRKDAIRRYLEKGIN